MKAVAAVAGVALVAVLPAVAAADEVYFKGGGRLVGVVLERNAQRILLEVGPGQVAVPLSRVDHVVSGPSPLAVFRDRAARLARNDVAGWLELAVWAGERELTTQSREAYERVLTLDPRNSTAHLALGHVMVSGEWLPLDESYRARGYVPFEGSWVLPEERAAMLKDRADETVAERARAEADARAREAEARAREAEAEARRAEIEAEQAAAAPIYSPGYGPFVGFPVVTVPRAPRCAKPRAPRPAPQPGTAPRERPRHGRQTN
jgi:hypothetical protein